MTIKIPVSAEFNGDELSKQIGQINARLKQMGDAVAKANGTRFEPITLRGKEDLKYFVQQSEKLLKIQTELKNRMARSDQAGKNPLMANWSQMYPNEGTRMRKMQEALVFMGASFAPGASSPPPRRPSMPIPSTPPANSSQPSGGNGVRNNPWVQQGARVFQAGLSAAGPFGNVASGAVGSGMASGFGAGLMGLVGGMAALGVGKLVGAVTEKIDQAEKNNIAYDTLKRTIGDVNVSFDGLKSVIQSSANNLGITFDEAGKLATQFSKLSNLSGGNYKSLYGELNTGVSFSRGFGLDPSMGVNMFGTLRGLGITKDEQGTRKAALLIGETIGKSGAFAKADEVMGAIADFATQQTHNSLSAANIAGYGGALSALVKSGIPGLDVAGAAGMLGRVNSSLMAGGAKGEASQFFTSRVGNRLGLSPIQMAIMKEGGAFATADQTFGNGSMYARYMGKAGPGGSTTFLQGTLDEIRKAYPDKGMQAMATANHLGIGISQAMSLLSIKPDQLGWMQKALQASGVDLSKVNAGGIANLTKVFGSDADRKGVASSLLGREDVTSAEKEKIKNAMEEGTEQQKKVLAEIVATHDQERTTGTDIRDSKALLDNIKTQLADKLVPAVNEMRVGILYMAGQGGKVSYEAMVRGAAESKYGESARRIKADYKSQIDVQAARYNAAKARTAGIPTAEEAALPRDQQMAAMVKRQKEAQAEMDAASAEIKRLEGKRDKEIAANTAAMNSEIDKDLGGAPSNWKPGTSDLTKLGITDPEQLKHARAGLEAISQVEGANYNTIVGGGTFSDFSQHPNKVGITTGDGPSTAAGRYQITKSTYDRLARKLGITGFGQDAQDAIAIALLKEKGAYQDLLNGDMDAVNRKMGGVWQGLPSGTSTNQNHRSKAEFNKAYQASIDRQNAQPAQLPASDPTAAGLNVKVTADPIVVQHVDARGQQVAPAQTINTRVSAPQAFGSGR